jgi:hypothetical protein
VRWAHGVAFERAAWLAPVVSAIRSRSGVRFAGGALSVFVHLALLAVTLSMGVKAGDPSALPVLFVQDFSIRVPIRQPQRPQEQWSTPELESIDPPEPEILELVDRTGDPVDDESLDDLIIDTQPTNAQAAADSQPSFLEQDSATPTLASTAVALPPTRAVEIPPEQRARLLERIAQAAQTLADTPQTEIAWEEDGRRYHAVLKRQALASSMELERVVAEVKATDQGTRMHTQLWLSRLAFSQFGQIVDRWDPNVQLHDDEIVGRFHSNTSVNIRRSREAMPKFLDKVTIAARRQRLSGLRQHEKEMFQGGLQIAADDIPFPARAAPFVEVPHDPQAHVHRFTNDAHIVLYGDGSYTWQSRRTDTPLVQRYAPDAPVYLLGAKGVTLYVRGVVRGYVLVYSPERIVIEGNLTYADDPRANPNSADYLGLVADRSVEIARAHVTGRGDLRIDAAIFARRRFVVTDIDRPHRATLRIYGSLSAGTLSASEPRYATKIEFDPRFDRVRPPGFPSTNRYELERWDGTWLEASVDEL